MMLVSLKYFCVSADDQRLEISLAADMDRKGQFDINFLSLSVLF